MALGSVTLDLAALSTHPGLGFLLVLVQATLVTAVVLGALGVPHPRGVGRGVAALLGVVAAVAPLGGLAWFVVDGGDQLTRDRDAGIPAYMVQSSERGPEHGILVVRGSVAEGLTYTLRRDDGVLLGVSAAAIQAAATQDDRLNITEDRI